MTGVVLRATAQDPLPVNKTEAWLLADQDGRCYVCSGTLHAATDRPQTRRDWDRWLTGNRAAIRMITVPASGTTGTAERRLIHTAVFLSS